jgi:hypothetical protein
LIFTFSSANVILAQNSNLSQAHLVLSLAFDFVVGQAA